jgi:hypothetical protein
VNERRAPQTAQKPAKARFLNMPECRVHSPFRFMQVQRDLSALLFLAARRDGF